MALEFQRPPDWLLQQYMEQRNNPQQLLDSAQKMAQTYATVQQNKQVAANKNDEAYVAAFQAGGPELAAQIASRRGIQSPPVLPGAQTPVPSTGTVPSVGYDVNASTPTEMTAQQSLPAEHPQGSPLVHAWYAQNPDHAKVTGYQPPSQQQVGDWMNQGNYGKAKLDEASKAKALLAEPAMEPVMSHSDALNAGVVPKGTRIIEPPAPRLDIGTKEDQFYQGEWDKLLKESDPLNASSRTPLGMASKSTFQANRALSTLAKPIVTYQEAGNVMSDIAAIYQGGAPTQFGMSHQAYTTLYGKVQNALQSLTGKPQDTVPDEIKQRLVGVLNDMKTTNRGVIKQRLDLTERSKSKVIQRFPQEWKDYRKTLEGDAESYSGLDPATSATGGWTYVGPAK